MARLWNHDGRTPPQYCAQAQHHHVQTQAGVALATLCNVLGLIGLLLCSMVSSWHASKLFLLSLYVGTQCCPEMLQQLYGCSA